jgi:glycosyltransferase involved in cell wall biosynthesis
MRVLALSPWWPFPADNGARMRIASLLEALALHHEVHLVAMSQEPITAEQQAIARHICASANEVRQREWVRQPFEQLVSLWKTEPASVRATWNPAFAALAQERAITLKPDIILVCSLRAAPYALHIAGIPRILEELEITNLLYDYQQAPSHRRLRAWLTWTKHQSFVRTLLRGFHACTVVSENERNAVRMIAPSQMPIEIIPNGTAIEPFASPPHPRPDTLIYPGALSYSANLDAMQYFIQSILPDIRAKRPAVRLQITGKTTEEQRAALPSVDGVDLQGYVPDIRRAVAEAWCEVVPLRQGGGTRLKILEALSVGTPVIATSKGAEGLDLVHGRDLLIADSPADFAAASLRLLGDSALRTALATAGHTAVRDRYDWRAIGARLTQLIESTVKRSEAPHESLAD